MWDALFRNGKNICRKRSVFWISSRYTAFQHIFFFSHTKTQLYSKCFQHTNQQTISQIEGCWERERRVSNSPTHNRSNANKQFRNSLTPPHPSIQFPPQPVSLDPTHRINGTMTRSGSCPLTGEIAGHGTWPHYPGNLNDLVQGDAARVTNCRERKHHTKVITACTIINSHSLTVSWEIFSG